LCLSTAIMTNAILPRPMTFLTLAPATSSSYPQPQSQRVVAPFRGGSGASSWVPFAGGRLHRIAT